MLKSVKKIALVLMIFVTPVFISGCGNNAQDSALLGAAIGTGIGAISGGDPASMMIGGAIGGGIGYWLGNEAEENGVETVVITNTNGSQSSVTLRNSGDGYIGPRNEFYKSRPTEEQLRLAYGF